MAADAPGAALSDAAVAIFAFAAYHQLENGQPVRKVVRDDGKGHHANDAAVHELAERDLVTIDGNDITFSEGGLALLARGIAGLKRALGHDD